MRLEKAVIRKFLLKAACVFIASFVFAAGKKDIEEESLGAQNSWQEYFDINEKKPGKYNVMVTAEDNAENKTIEGPFNIWIDPESDLPVVSITNPMEQMRIPGNLNIVGSCVDDDAVDHVNLILDGNYDDIKTAEGKDFWSFYVDTNNLFEGPHTIEVYGTDINGLRGHSVKLTWQLDRRQPVTTVRNYNMGDLVAGKIKLEGAVTDGNGIKSLEYSVDGGKVFHQAKIKEVKYAVPDEEGHTSEWVFSIPIDTTKFKDGPATCWFKAVDNTGSIGRFAFLYFIDNTEPDVKIITPKENEKCNGIFTVAGYAKDTIGIESVSWQWGNESGVFDLVPGNPYWVKEVSAMGKDKSEVFSVTAVDVMGNSVTKKIVIPIDHEADKPVVHIKAPENNLALDGTKGSVYLRGIATDDDGVVSVTYSVDGGEEITINTTGIFSTELDQDFEYGEHRISVYATDRYGTRGDTVTVNFIARGGLPEFDAAVFKYGDKSELFYNGMTVNPELDGIYEITAKSTCGIQTLDWELSWGIDSSIKGKTVNAGGEKSASIRVPLYGENLPWGVAQLTITATDVFDRISEEKSIVAITNLTRVNSNEIGLFFTDSSISRNGGFMYKPGVPLTGFMLGTDIESVSISPAIRGVTVSVDSNVITVNSTGPTEKFVVNVKAKNGYVTTSREMYFYLDEKPPVLTLDPSDLFSTEELRPFEFKTTSDTLRITGKASGETALTLRYRILAAQAQLPLGAGGLITTSQIIPSTEWREIPLSQNGTFILDNLNFNSFENGISVIEISAQGVSGIQSAQAVFVRKIPYPPSETIIGPDGKEIPKATPKVFWLSGIDYYGVCVYQGSVDIPFAYVRSSEITADQDSINFTVTPLDVEARTGRVPTYSADMAVRVRNSIRPTFTQVDDTQYKSGMPVTLERGTKINEGHVIKLDISSRTPIESVNYTIEAESSVGGTQKQTGSASLKTVEEGALYRSEIPLADLPAGVIKISAEIRDIKGNKRNANATITVLRTHSIINDDPLVYWIPVNGTTYNAKAGAYVLRGKNSMFGYGNFRGPLEAKFSGSVNGLALSTAANNIKLTGITDGQYKNLRVRVNSTDGGVYNAPEINLLVDNVNPELELTSPAPNSWVKSSFVINGRASDASGIESLEYSLGEAHAAVYKSSSNKKSDIIQISEKQKEMEWKPFKFGQTIDLSEFDDGYIPLTVRATDLAGNVKTIHTCLLKDTTPPQVTVILPEDGAIVNGENRMVLKVQDISTVETITYMSADKTRKTEFRHVVNMDGASFEDEASRDMNSPLPNLMMGNERRPMDNAMTFTFTDAAGNTTTISDWQFTVAEDSDKPVSEIHLPEDNQVITTDFVISGIIYDDDGPCHVYYKIDNGQFTLVSEEKASSYKINVPLHSMTDNEHTVTVYAVDANGVKGEETVSRFRISLEEPQGAVISPQVSETVRETITLRGWATDENGISRVQISVDNGASYNDAVLIPTGQKNRVEWNYTFDTRVIQDGTHAIFLKIWDGYDITGLFSSLINIDNTPPDLRLELPLDDSKTSQNIFLSGQTTDNIGLTKLYLTITSLEGRAVPERLARRTLEPGEIISQAIDISELSNGFYNIELAGEDAAGNISRVSRNLQLDKTRPLVTADLLYPLNGEHLHGEFNIYGITTSEKEDPVQKVELYLDGKKLDAVPDASVSATGYFMFHLENHMTQQGYTQEQENGSVLAVPAREAYLEEGEHSYQVIVTTKAGKTVTSNEQTFIYSKYGPWVTIDNFAYGDFAVNRPMLKGSAGYTITEEEKEALKSKETSSEERNAIEAKRVKQISLSFDNGRTYKPVARAGKNSWQYRVENLDIPAGYHFMLLRAEMENGEYAITRTVVKVDRTAPTIRMISPGVGGRYNQALEFGGLASDDVELKDIKLTLRKGDKAAYEIPAGLQGLYFDVSLWGATLYNFGVGITAFDGAVKIQANFGQFTQNQRDFVSDLIGVDHTSLRFGGNVIGAKIIAQVFYLPFRYFFGRDFDWLTATLAVGANFSYFTETGASLTTSEPVPQMLSAAFAQVEFPRMTFSKQKYFKTWAVYTEPQIWFIPSDVASASVNKYVFTTSIGLRANVF